MLRACRFFLPALALLLAALLPLTARADTPDTPPEHFTLDGQALVLNGTGTRHKAVFKVYQAHLYLPQKTHSFPQVVQQPGPKRLEIHMLRDIDANELGRLFVKGIEQNTPRQELGHVLPSVARIGQLFAQHKKLRNGDSLVLDWVPGTGMSISVNGQPQGTQFADPAFFTAMLGIWLGDRPTDARLKQALLGTDTAQVPQQGQPTNQP